MPPMSEAVDFAPRLPLHRHPDLVARYRHRYPGRNPSVTLIKPPSG
jgi:hypothetical protein